MAEGGGSALRELLASFFIEVDDHELKEASESIGGFLETIKGAGKKFAEAFAVYELKEFVESQIEAGAQLKIMAERLGTDTNELQAMQLAAGEAGVSSESMNTALRFLNRNLGDAAAGSGDAAQTFASMGIAIKDASGQARPAGDVMGDLADHLAKIDDTGKKTQIAMKLLGRGGAELIPLLNKGGEAFEEARKSMEELGGGLSKDFVEQAHSAEEANVRLSFALKGLKSNLAIALLPDFKKIVETITEWTAATVKVAKQSGILGDALGFVKAGAVVLGLYKLVGAFRALATAEGLAALLNPFTLWVIGIGLVLFAYNDLKVALEGGKSVFGDLFGQTGIDKLRTQLREAATVVDLLKASLDSVYDVLAGIANVGVGALLAAGHALGLTKDDGSDRAAAASKNFRDVGQEWDEAERSTREREDAAARVTGGPGGRAVDLGTQAPAGEGRRNPLAITRTGLAARQAVAFSRTAAPVARQPVAFARTSYAPPPGPRGPSGGSEEPVIIHQKVETHVEFHGDVNNPEQMSRVTRGAVATGTQRANANAKTTFKKP